MPDEPTNPNSPARRFGKCPTCGNLKNQINGHCYVCKPVGGRGKPKPKPKPVPQAVARLADVKQLPLTAQSVYAEFIAARDILDIVLPLGEKAALRILRNVIEVLDIKIQESMNVKV